MGVGASRTETFANPNLNIETVKIQVTSDVYDRVQAQLLSSLSGKIGAAEVAGPLQNEAVRMKDGMYYQPVSNHVVNNSQLEHGQEVFEEARATRSEEKVQSIKETRQLSSIRNVEHLQGSTGDGKDREGQTSQFEDFERAIDSAKQSLRELNDALPQEKVVLGVGADGRPTLETVGAWKVRQEKEEELRQNDLFWMGKLEALKGEYINSVLEDVESFFERTEKLKTASPVPKENPCASFCSKVANCYASNKNEVLSCRSVVDEFSHCVQRSVAP